MASQDYYKTGHQYGQPDQHPQHGAYPQQYPPSQWQQHPQDAFQPSHSSAPYQNGASPAPYANQGAYDPNDPNARGLGTFMAGGAAAGITARKLGGGFFGTLAAAAIGGYGANKIKHLADKRGLDENGNETPSGAGVAPGYQGGQLPQPPQQHLHQRPPQYLPPAGHQPPGYQVPQPQYLPPAHGHQPPGYQASSPYPQQPNYIQQSGNVKRAW